MHEAWPKTHHMARRILRSDNASYARALDRAHNLSRLRDETGITSDRFEAGNDRNASPEELELRA